MNALIKLESMIGKPYYYRNQPVVIKRYDNSHDDIEIWVEVDGKPKQFLKPSEEKLELFLANFTEVETVNEPEQKQRESSVPAIPKNQENELFKQTQNTFSELSTMLMDDIKKVREKPEYVSQAKQVCNSVNAMVNMTKLQMQILKNR
jgi:hypothetical protein